ncbi:hypothetical protein [Catenuloplanes indicus]|uniref:Uncharacterized protein n=1 Tax=Catenuloplanes indicus TaxID=137267 RepID=A0AAE3VXH0_9ACTN|nr:hypothetical protein [Catenuloplanes indicus]MDQ0365024.1 hypothetical protein [Catenuloplanes indicus]
MAVLLVAAAALPLAGCVEKEKEYVDSLPVMTGGRTYLIAGADKATPRLISMGPDGEVRQEAFALPGCVQSHLGGLQPLNATTFGLWTTCRGGDGEPALYRFDVTPGSGAVRRDLGAGASKAAWSADNGLLVEAVGEVCFGIRVTSGAGPSRFMLWEGDLPAWVEEPPLEELTAGYPCGSRRIDLRHLVVSADGALFAFGGDALISGGHSGDLVVLHAATGEVAYRARSLDRTVYLALSPDGRRLVQSGTRGKESGVWVIDITSGAETRISDDIDQPAFTPDGRSVSLTCYPCDDPPRVVTF